MTDTTPAARFQWQRISNDADGDILWNNRHQGVKIVDVTTREVHAQATFRCDILAE